MKKADFITNIILVPIDFILVFLASISAYYVRFSPYVAEIRPVIFELPLSEYLILTIKVSLFAMVIFAFSGFYTMRSKKLIKEFPKIVTGVSMVFIFIVLDIFWQRELFESRFILIFAWALAIVYLSFARILSLFIRNIFFQKGYGLSNVIVLGEIENRQAIVKEYRGNKKLGYKVVFEFNNLAELEASQDAKESFKKKNIFNIIQTDSSIDKHQALDLLTFCQENHVNLKYVASLWQTQSLHTNLSSVAGLPIVEIQDTTLDGWRKVAKRILDTILSFLLLIILLPVFLLIAIIIKISSPGSIFVSLTRVGAKGKMFRLYKFRSMVKDAHKLKKEILENNERSDGPLFKMKNDPRVTKFGKFLRKTSLDELPQLFNVLKGQMSLVGPRPHEPEEVSKYQKGYKKLLAIKPGITGMAQVSGRSNLAFAEEAKLDIFYIENWSVGLDLVILLKTIKVVFKNEDAC